MDAINNVRELNYLPQEPTLGEALGSPEAVQEESIFEPEKGEPSKEPSTSYQKGLSDLLGFKSQPKEAEPATSIKTLSKKLGIEPPGIEEPFEKEPPTERMEAIAEKSPQDSSVSFASVLETINSLFPPQPSI